jgi:uncharacterized RDD family membrane protein YckC
MMAMLMALTSGDNVFWWVAIGVGFVVVLVVIVLLSLLMSFVKDIDNGVGDVLDTAGRVAANTANTSQLVETLNLCIGLNEETARHAALLTK